MVVVGYGVCLYFWHTRTVYRLAPFQWLRPTYEGLALGWKQVLKIVAMLTGLSLLLSTTTQKELISGLYQFMSLFSGLGLNAERFTSRLWLTMHYVEQRGDTRIKIHSIKDFFDELSIEPLSENTHKHIELTLLPITLFEKVILIIMLSVILWVVGS